MQSVRRRLLQIIRYMPPSKLDKLLKFAQELDAELTPKKAKALQKARKLQDRLEIRKVENE